MPSICLVYGFEVALGGFARPFCILPSTSSRAWLWVASTVSLADITRPGGGWGRPREPESYLRRVSGACPARVRRVSGACPARVRRDSHESPRLPQPVWLMQLGLLSATCRQADLPP